MKKIKLTLIANNLKKWHYWDEKVKFIKAWGWEAKVDFEIDLIHTKYRDIPFIDYSYVGDNYDKGIIIGNNLWGVDPPWYDQNVSSLARDRDVVAFIIPPNQWKGQKSAGWRYDHNLGPIEVQVLSTSEFETYEPGDGRIYNHFLLYLFHELSHVLYEIAGIPDRTHEFYYAGDWYCEKAIASIQWPQANYASDDPTWWERFLNLLNFLRTINVAPPEIKPPLEVKSRLDDFCLAIQKHEGWIENPPSRSFRNNNPGNLRYVGQAKAIGADKSNFAVFSTYQDGFDTLKEMVRKGAAGLSKVYFPEDTIADFFNKYAPPFENDSDAYAKVVASALGVDITFKIKNLIS